MNFAGAVLCGGASQRFGEDKSLYVMDGKPMAKRVLEALQAAGAEEVMSIGGDVQALSEMGFVAIADDFPGEGPLGGIITAMRHAGSKVLAVMSCDLPYASAETIIEIAEHLAAGQETQAVFPLDEKGTPQYLHGIWRTACLPKLETAFQQGGRSIKGGLSNLPESSVEYQNVSNPQTLKDLDKPPR